MAETQPAVHIMAPETAQLKAWLAGILATEGGDIPTVEVLASVGSTNRYLLETVKGDATARPRVCLAQEQTHGRGRRGRTWYSRAGCSLALSLAWPLGRLRVPPAYPVGAGIGVVRALRAIGINGVGLKWPNDLVSGAAKLGGILVEPLGAGKDRCGWLVVGIGLNRRGSGAWQLPREVTDLESLSSGGSPAWLELAGHIVAEQYRLHDSLLAQGIRPLQTELERVDILRDRRIEVLDTGVRGRADGIDPASGCLRVQLDGGGEEWLYSGEVSVWSCEND